MQYYSGIAYNSNVEPVYWKKMSIIVVPVNNPYITCTLQYLSNVEICDERKEGSLEKEKWK